MRYRQRERREKTEIARERVRYSRDGERNIHSARERMREKTGVIEKQRQILGWGGETGERGAREREKKNREER